MSKGLTHVSNKSNELTWLFSNFSLDMAQLNLQRNERFEFICNAQRKISAFQRDFCSANKQLKFFHALMQSAAQHCNLEYSTLAHHGQMDLNKK